MFARNTCRTRRADDQGTLRMVLTNVQLVWQAIKHGSAAGRYGLLQCTMCTEVQCSLPQTRGKILYDPCLPACACTVVQRSLSRCCADILMETAG